LLRITNERGLSRLLGVRCPKVAVAKKVISLLSLPVDWVRRRHYCAPAMWGPHMMAHPCCFLGRPELGSPSCFQLSSTLGRWRSRRPTPDRMKPCSRNMIAICLFATNPFSAVILTTCAAAYYSCMIRAEADSLPVFSLVGNPVSMKLTAWQGSTQILVISLATVTGKS